MPTPCCFKKVSSALESAPEESPRKVDKTCLPFAPPVVSAFRWRKTLDSESRTSALIVSSWKFPGLRFDCRAPPGRAGSRTVHGVGGNSVRGATEGENVVSVFKGRGVSASDAGK